MRSGTDLTITSPIIKIEQVNENNSINICVDLSIWKLFFSQQYLTSLTYKKGNILIQYSKGDLLQINANSLNGFKPTPIL